MLVLTRKVGERIYIGEDVVITLVEIRTGEIVAFGIDAPRHVEIDREEIRIAKRTAPKKKPNN